VGETGIAEALVDPQKAQCSPDVTRPEVSTGHAPESTLHGLQAFAELGHLALSYREGDRNPLTITLPGLVPKHLVYLLPVVIGFLTLTDGAVGMMAALLVGLNRESMARLQAECSVVEPRRVLAGPRIQEQVVSNFQCGGFNVLGRDYILRFLNDAHRDNSHGNSWARCDGHADATARGRGTAGCVGGSAIACRHTALIGSPRRRRGKRRCELTG